MQRPVYFIPIFVRSVDNQLEMYTRQQTSQLRQEFWTTFGQYMAPVPGYEGLKVNWLNYKTGEKDIRFRLDADNTKASIAIVITHADPVIRMLYFEQLRELKNIFHEFTQEEWLWLPEYSSEQGSIQSVVMQEQVGVNLFSREDWPQIIRFFKPRIIALDAFWYTVKDQFDVLK